MTPKLQAQYPLAPHEAAGDQAEEQMEEEGAGAVEEAATTQEAVPPMTHPRQKHHPMSSRPQARQLPRSPLVTAEDSNSVASCPLRAATRSLQVPMAGLLQRL